MVKYSCQRCGKGFTQKSHYDSHNKRKIPCETIIDKINIIVERIVEEKLEDRNKETIGDTLDVITTTNVTQTTGLNRKVIDKFYTRPFIANECINAVIEKINIGNTDLCIEPSAGNGSFIDSIKRVFSRYQFYDLEPENSEITKQDYLEYYYEPSYEYPDSSVHVIGNPPFGRQSSLAIHFIKKSCSFCDSISFILPKSFKKDSLKKHFPLKFHLIYEYDLPYNSFMVGDNEHDVPCVFQIWIKKDYCRVLPEKLIPNNYKFVEKSDEHDISFRRVGINAGEIDKNTDPKSIQSHYFIKFNIDFTDELFDELSNTVYNCKNNTCGPKSISKQELIKEFNKVC